MADTSGANGAPAPSRGHKKRARTRHQLVAAAVDVIGERGESFTVSDVTARAGLANGTFYNYFDDRDDLVATIVPDIVDAFAARSAAAVVEDDPAQRFASISARALERASSAPDQMRVLLRLEAAQRELVGGAPLEHLRADVASGHLEGRFAVGPSDAVVDVIAGSLLTAIRRIVDGEADDGYRRQVIEQLLRSLGVPDAEVTAIASRAVSDAQATAYRGTDAG